MARDLRVAISYADSVRDYVSPDLVINILSDKEEYVGWLETELDLIGRLGIQNHLQTHLKDVRDHHNVDLNCLQGQHRARSVNKKSFSLSGCFLDRFTYNARAYLKW